MNRGLLAKALRECWLGTLVFGVALLIVEALLAVALLRFQDLVSALGSQIPALQYALRVMLGATGTDRLSPEMIGAAGPSPCPSRLCSGRFCSPFSRRCGVRPSALRF